MTFVGTYFQAGAPVAIGDLAAAIAVATAHTAAEGDLVEFRGLSSSPRRHTIAVLSSQRNRGSWPIVIFTLLIPIPFPFPILILWH